jgi:CRP-like cAMP-binding protein
VDDLLPILREHPFCAGLSPDDLRLLVSCARNLRFGPGEFLLREGQCEEHLYLIRRGRVGLELQSPGSDAVCLETLGPGDVLGISCFVPHKASLDCRAVDSVVAIELDNACLLRKMNADPRLGYALSMRLLDLTYQRLARHRLQLLDVYK